MSPDSTKIPFAVEINRMIEVLAAQIYPTPFALLRENVQNAFDAILMRQHNGDDFEGQITVTIEPQRITVIDNGIGMSRDDLRHHFWRAGASSKNTQAARAAGVVGTFGIGAMANFGIAEELHVETESALTGERTASSAIRSTLSVTEECIAMDPITTRGQPGTQVVAVMQPDTPIHVQSAQSYIEQFVAFLPLAVCVNGSKVSGQPLDDAVPSLAETWSVSEDSVDLGDGFTADLRVGGALNGDVRVALSGIASDAHGAAGTMILRQGVGSLRTFRSGFGLATTSLSSIYGFGGVADLLFLEPTAGREALTTESMQILHKMSSRIDEFVSLYLAQRPESNGNSSFVTWAFGRRRFDLCGHLRVRREPGMPVALREIKELSQKASALVYSGTDRSTVEHASEDRPIVMLTHGSPRRECEMGYLRQYCKIEELSDEPKVLREKPAIETNGAEKALAFRLGTVLSNDYFLSTHIKFGKISHGVPVLVTQRSNPAEIFLDPASGTLRIILDVYESEFLAFGHMVKDFARNMIFPRVADLVPTATRQGAEAFLKSIHRAREVFEYESADLESLTTLWKDYMSGKLSFQQAAERPNRVATRSYQVVDGAAAGAMRDVVPDVIRNQQVAEDEVLDYGPMPPIQRLDIETSKKLLVIGNDEPALKGYRCFLALTNRIYNESGEFFCNRTGRRLCGVVRRRFLYFNIIQGSSVCTMTYRHET